MAQVQELITGPLAQALERDRERFNALFARASARNPGLAPEDFAAHLRDRVQPVVRAMADIEPEGAIRAATALCELSLELMERGLLLPGSRCPGVALAWERLFVLAARFLVQAPRRAAPALVNAAHNLEVQEGARPEQWLDIMEGLIPHCRNMDEMLSAGLAACWRAGMAQYRESAFKVWRTLTGEVAYLSLGLGKGEERPPLDDLSKILDNPWGLAGKGRGLEIVAGVGGFRGFGGPFVSPPEVAVSQGRLYAFDQEWCYGLHADQWGSVFVSYGKDLPEDADTGGGAFSLDEDGRVSMNGVTASFPELARAGSFAGTEDTLAVTLERSHRIVLIALTNDRA